MWAILAVIAFLAAQAYLLRTLKKTDGLLAAQAEPEEKALLSLAFPDPETAEALAGLLAAFSRDNPEVEMVLHTGPAVPEAVQEGRAAVGFLPENAGTAQGLESCPVGIPGLSVRRMVWKTGSCPPCAGVFVRYAAGYCEHPPRSV